jgi:hypothetical protein
MIVCLGQLLSTGAYDPSEGFLKRGHRLKTVTREEMLFAVKIDNFSRDM